MNKSTTAQQQQRLRRQQQEQHRRQQLLAQLQQQKANYVSNYDLPLNYPAKVVASASNTTDNSSSESSKKTLRTSSEFVNARLLESGLSFDGSATTTSNNDNASSNNYNKSTLANHSMSINRFINNLEGTGCYDAIQVHLSPSSDNDTNDVTVQLKEKNWYKLYIGGGVNSDDLSTFSNASSSTTTAGNVIQLPKVQFETSASLLNLTGYTDVTSASYIVDQTGSTSCKLIHDRPLISYLNNSDSIVRRWLMPAHPNDAVDTTTKQNEVDELEIDNQLAIGGGTQTSLGIHATFHDVDYESTRSYKEYIRCLGVRLANHARGASGGGGGGGSYKPSTSTPESMSGPYTYLDWNIALKDVLPKRSSTHPYILDCSSDIAKQSGTYLKHSLEGGLYMNGCLCNDRYDPTLGYDYHIKGEVAGPPGDVGFVKLHCGYNWHLPVELIRLMMFGVNHNDNGYIKEKNDSDESPLVAGMALHSSFNFGILRPLTFNGLLGSGVGGNNSPSSLVPSSDRFYIGGPGQLRGFLPAGIGPRSTEGGSSVPGGDALGGDLFYASMLSTSIPFPTYFATLRNNGGRLFGFVNAGTCVAVGGDRLNMSSAVCNRILQSSRVSVGGGVSAGLPMGRFEATYAIPIRCGPRDARKAVQFGFGFSFG